MSTKRDILDSSMEESSNKRTALSTTNDPDDTAPAWAQQLTSQVTQAMANMGAILQNLDSLNKKFAGLEVQQSENTDKIAAAVHETDQLRQENKDLRGRVNKLELIVTDIADRNMRDTIVLQGIPEDALEKTWEDCAEKVAHWLAANLGGTFKQYNTEIYRCHRGAHNPNYPGPRQIFCAIRFRTAEKIRKLFENGKKVRGVSQKDMYSADTTAKRNQAMLYRKQHRDANPQDKLYVAYPAKVMIKRPADTKYNVLKQF